MSVCRHVWTPGWISAAIIAVTAAGACGDPTGPAHDVVVRTAGTAFERLDASGTARVPFEVLNRGAAQVYVLTCDRILAVVDRWQDGRWAEYRSDSLRDCPPILGGWTPAQVSPGGRAEGERIFDAEPGRYRLRVAVSDRIDGAFEFRVASNVFTVE